MAHNLPGRTEFGTTADKALIEADGDTAYFQHTTSGEGIDIEVHLAGDCLSPRSAEEAIYEGFMVGRRGLSYLVFKW